MAQRLNPAARDAAVRRITMVTTGVVALGLAGTVGLGVTIASATPVKKPKPAAGAVPAPQGQVAVPQNKVAVPPAPNGAAPKGTAPKGTPQQQGKPAPAPKPQPTTQAPETSSGGS